MKRISFILAFVLFLGCFSFAGFTEDKADAPAIVIKKGVVNEWEAEGQYANIMHHYSVGTEIAGYSGDGFIYVPRNIGLKSTAVWPTDTPPHIYYNLDVQEDGVYYLWLRIYSENSGSDSSFVCFNDAPPSYNEFMDYGEWAWYLVSTEYLSSGKHTFNFL